MKPCEMRGLVTPIIPGSASSTRATSLYRAVSVLAVGLGVLFANVVPLILRQLA